MSSFDKYTCAVCVNFRKGAVEKTDVQGSPKIRVSRVRKGLNTCALTGEPVRPQDIMCQQGRKA